MAKQGSCGAKKKGGGTCGNAAGLRTDHPGYGCCWLHLGKTPMVARKAYQEMARDLLDNQPITMGMADLDPAQGLMMLIRKSASFMNWLEAKVEADGPDQMSYYDEKGICHISVWVQLYNEERDRLANHIGLALKLGLEERQVRLAERQGEMLYQVMQEALTELGLNKKQQDMAPSVMQRMLAKAAAIDVGSMEVPSE